MSNRKITVALFVIMGLAWSILSFLLHVPLAVLFVGTVTGFCIGGLYVVPPPPVTSRRHRCRW